MIIFIKIPKYPQKVTILIIKVHYQNIAKLLKNMCQFQAVSRNFSTFHAISTSKFIKSTWLRSEMGIKKLRTRDLVNKIKVERDYKRGGGSFQQK